MVKNAGYYTFAVQLTYSGFKNGIGSHTENFKYAVKPFVPVLALSNIITGIKVSKKQSLSFWISLLFLIKNL